MVLLLVALMHLPSIDIIGLPFKCGNKSNAKDLLSSILSTILTTLSKVSCEGKALGIDKAF